MWLFIALKCNNHRLSLNKIIYDMDRHILTPCCYSACGEGWTGYALFSVVIG